MSAAGDGVGRRQHGAVDVWFREQLRRIFPPDVGLSGRQPPLREIFDSQEFLVAR